MNTIFDGAHVAGRELLSILVGSQPQFGVPIDLESAPSSLLGSVLLAQLIFGMILTG